MEPLSRVGRSSGRAPRCYPDARAAVRARNRWHCSFPSVPRPEVALGLVLSAGMDRLEMIGCITVSLSEVLERDVADVSENTRLLEDLSMDSTSVLELLMALEDNAGVEIDAENLDMDDFRTVGT